MSIMFKAVISILIIFSLSLNSWAKTDPEVESCKTKILAAVDKIQSISNQVPDKAFGSFVKTGSFFSLTIAVTKLGGGNPVSGAKALFKKALPVFEKNKKKIFAAARACEGHCDKIKALKIKCDEVNELSGLLNDLDIENAYELSKYISNYGGTKGIKETVEKEVVSYYRDRD